MKNLLPIFIFITLIIVSCSTKTPLQQLIHDADVVKVFVYSGDKTSMHFETNDIDKIQYWKNYIADDSVIQKSDCNENGKIIFKTADDSTVMHFSTKENCAYAVYELNGKNYCKSITNEGRKFIDSLMKIN